MKKILAIGNSFSEDATYYLHDILDEAGIESKVVNLYIGGCTLEKHWQNIIHNKAEYQFQYNGQKTDRYISIKQMLDETDWDIIYTQQASAYSGWQVSYEPFLTLMSGYIREAAPNAKQYLCETWAYAKDFRNDLFQRYDNNQDVMYSALKACYYDASQRHALPLIPCGDMIQNLRKTELFSEEHGKYAICRDGYHMNYIYGRYALGLQLAKTFFDVEPETIKFVPSSIYQPLNAVDFDALSTIKANIL